MREQPNEGSKKRPELFKIYSKNVSIFFPSRPQPLFICPICLKEFGEDSVRNGARLDGSKLTVNIAHCYPDALGGNLFTLTCAACNERMNRHFDHHLSKEAKTYRVMDPSEPDTLDGRVQINGHTITAEFSVATDNKPRVVMSRDRSNPHDFDSVVKYLNAFIDKVVPGVPAFSPIPSQRMEPDRVSIALAHTAYLMMFRAFGYEFVVSPMAEEIRRVLLMDELPEKIGFFLLNIPKTDGNPELLNTVGILTHPVDRRCLYAMMPSPDKKMIGRCILLPGPGEQGEKAREVMNRSCGEKIPSTFLPVGSKFEDNAYRLTTRAYRHFLRSLWFDTPFEDAAKTEALIVVYEAVNNGVANSIAVAHVAQLLGLELGQTVELIRANIEMGWVRVDSESLSTCNASLTSEGVKAAFETSEAGKL
jgi:hypothetical protein